MRLRCRGQYRFLAMSQSIRSELDYLDISSATVGCRRAAQALRISIRFSSATSNRQLDLIFRLTTLVREASATLSTAGSVRRVWPFANALPLTFAALPDEAARAVHS